MIKDLLNKCGIKPNKRMGQNFLIDESVLEKIISAAELSENDSVLEIGPGLGILTFALAKKAKKVIAVEKDKDLARILNNELRIKNIKNVEIVHSDILKVHNSLFQIHDSYKLVANLPYYITSPIIRMFLENPPAGKKPELMVLMIQKEVAERICAKLGQMSILSIAVQFYARPEIISIVPKTSFYPQPKVDSAIIKILPKKILPKIDTEKFFNLTRAGFSAKRKFLISNLSRKLQIANGELQIAFRRAEIDLKSRAENLNVEDWIKIYENIEKNI